MMSVYNLKPAFQRLLIPACDVLHRVGVTPNHITAATLAASVGMGLWLLLTVDRTVPLWVMPVFLLLRMAANALDGMIARTYGLTTRTGAVFNEVADVLADAALYLPFAAVPGIRTGFPVAIVVLAAVTEVAGLAAMTVGGTRRHDGPMGKSDRALAFAMVSVLCAAGVRSRAILDGSMGVIVVLLLATIVNRCRHPAKVRP
jgi:CDP-diacylglycerol--glycerol-3-phosphate 3-phosphatidyltransferase